MMTRAWQDQEVIIFHTKMKVISKKECEECFGHFRKVHSHWRSEGVILVKFKSIENQKGKAKKEENVNI